MIAAELDPLHDEGIAYTQKLQQSGNTVKIITHEQMIHGFIGYIGVIDEALTAIKQTSNWISQLD